MTEEQPRYLSLLHQAKQGTFKAPFDPPFEPSSPPKTVEELQAVLAKSPSFETLSSSASQFFHPSEIYWRHAVAQHAHQLEMFQDHPNLANRDQALEGASKKLAEAEAELEKVAGSPPRPAGWYRASVISKKIKIKVNDQVVIAAGGVTVKALQETLSAVDQCLPMIPTTGRLEDDRDYSFARGIQGHDLATAIGLNLPHGLEAQCGSWRDWVLGMTILLADGTIVHSGSQAVKNVAGYDAHKLMIGAYGTLGIVLEVILRTWPLEALPEHQVESRKPPLGEGRTKDPLWIQRTRPSNFQSAVQAAGKRAVEIDWASSTLWAHVPYEEELARFHGDWVVRRGCLEKSLQITDPHQIALMKRAKAILDPENKLNPGAMGVV